MKNKCDVVMAVGLCAWFSITELCVVDLGILQDTHRDVKYDSHTAALA